jgi:multidrug efflux system membrane fusion protein
MPATLPSVPVEPVQPPKGPMKPHASSSPTPQFENSASAAAIPEGRSGRWNWLIGLILIALVATGWHFRAQWLPYTTVLIERLSPPKPAKPPPRVVTVGTAPVGQRDVDLYLYGLGTVTAFKTVTVRSRVEGELVEVAIDEGQAVEEGDLLARIDPRTWQAQLDQAEAQLRRDEATLKAAKLTLTRYEQLLNENIVSAQQIDEQLSLVQQSEAAVKADEAQIANARLQLDFCEIHAPLSGRIGLRLVDAGNIVQANDPRGLAVITQLQPISLVFTIPQDDIVKVLEKSRGETALSVEAFDRDLRHKLAIGKLAAIDNQVDPTTGTLRLKAVFNNEDEALFPNQFVNARLKVDTLSNATVAPTAAVQRGPSSAFVYVLQPDDTVAIREITTGPTSGTDTVVLSGLTPGEIVVTDGLDKLQAGAKVTTKERAEKKGQSKSDGGDGKSPSSPPRSNTSPADKSEPVKAAS